MKKFLFITVFTMLAMLLVSCGNKNQSTEKLYLYNWGEYMDPDLLKQFREETGIEVIPEEFDTNESMFPRIKTGAAAYDVVIPSDYMIQRMIQEDLLAEINYDNIPNYKYISEDYKNLAYDPENKYSVPYMTGTVGILYNTTMVSEPVDSWSILFDEKYSNQILMQKSVRDAFAVALKYLGYSLNTTNETELEEAKNLLIQQKPLVQAYVIDEVRDKMIGEEAALAVIYSGEAIYTRSENSDLAYAIPKEGSNVWVDGLVIPKNAPNKENAEKFINFLCDPEVGLVNTEYIGYSTPNVETMKLLPEELLSDPAAYPDSAVLKNCEVFTYLGDEIDARYNQKWKEVNSK